MSYINGPIILMVYVMAFIAVGAYLWSTREDEENE